MKFLFRTVTALLCVAALWLLIGCQMNTPDESLQTISTTAPIDAASYYINASQAVHSGQNLTMQIQLQTEITVNGSVFKKNISQSLQLMNRDTEYMRAALDETWTTGSQSVSIRERFANGMMYMSVNDSRFVSSISAADYQARFVTGDVLTPSLYGSVTSFAAEEGVEFLFESPSAPETWAVPADAQLLSASGSALIDVNGQLLRCNYTVTYTQGSSEITDTWVFHYKNDVIPSIDVPSTLDGYITVTDARIPRILEEATGYLTQADSISAELIQQIQSEAFGISRKQSSHLHMYDREDSLLACRNVLVELISHSNDDEVTNTTQTEHFADGSYQITTNAGMNSTSQMTDEAMRAYCQELLVSSILLPEYITDITVSQTDSVCRLDFTASEKLAELFCYNACEVLYDDSQLLNALASEYATNEITAYLEIDLLTGLPVASGIHYIGTHTIQQTAYVLSSKVDQVYTPVSEIAYDAIIASNTETSTEPSVEETTEATEATA